MVAASRLRKKENTFRPEVSGERLPDLLKVAAIYGPNAAGKTSVVRALDFLGLMARRQPAAIQPAIPVSSFRFDKALTSQPSLFEVHFICQNQRYQFELAVTSDRVMREALTCYPQGKETILYERTFSSAGEKYVFGERLEGGAELHLAWQNLTNPKILFIAQAVANSSESLQQLRVPFGWLSAGVRVMDATYMHGWKAASQELARDYPSFAEDISVFLQDFDVPVTHMRFETVDGVKPDDTGSEIRTQLTHKSALGEALFEFEEESSGTQNLIGFWLPWGAFSRQLGGRKILVVDELDSSLHPKIVADLVSRHIHQNEPSQLIFTTHDTHLMDTKILRRDQIWIVERDMNGATNLNSVHDFEGREGEDVEKRYFEGRYRGLPFLRKKY
jgi:hypothetical protein